MDGKRMRERRAQAQRGRGSYAADPQRQLAGARKVAVAPGRGMVDVFAHADFPPVFRTFASSVPGSFTGTGSGKVQNW
jgi:hypothetical protein